jgi:hypothetical protein
MGARTSIAAADLILRLPFVACNTQNVEKRALRRPDARLYHQHFSTIRSLFGFSLPQGPPSMTKDSPDLGEAD